MSFLEFAASHGLIIDHAIPDRRWHRTRTHDHPKKRNGSYITDGQYGAVINWATMTQHAVYRPTAGISLGLTSDDKRRLQALIRVDASRKHARQARAASLAEALLKAAVLRRPSTYHPGRRLRLSTAHPYLVKKGLLTESCLELPVDHQGMDAGSMLVPMRDAITKKLIGMQVIAPDGDKRFLPGQRSRGAVHVLGGDRRLAVLVEGYATGLSVHQAIKSMYRQGSVVVCFSAANLMHVANLGIGTHVFADNDESRTGENAAIATGLPWCMAPVAGWDANDLHVSQGLNIVQDILRTIV